jgi:hypothetical protein
MLRKARGRNLLILGVFAAATAIAVPLALGGGESETFTACYKSGSGDLRIDLGNGCNKNEVGIQLTGSMPPPRTAFSNVVDSPVDLGEAETTVNTLEITEEGPYVIVGKAFFESPQTGGTFFCKGVGTEKFGTAGDSGVILPFQSTVPAGTDTVELVCGDAPGADIVVQRSVLTAIPVDNLVTSSG